MFERLDGQMPVPGGDPASLSGDLRLVDFRSDNRFDPILAGGETSLIQGGEGFPSSQTLARGGLGRVEDQALLMDGVTDE
jgi:hypothetical protein